MAMRYIERNRIRAELTGDPSAWPWSSAVLHLGCTAEDPLVNASPGPTLEDDWTSDLLDGLPEHEFDLLEHLLRIGRPSDDDRFLERLEKRPGRAMRP